MESGGAASPADATRKPPSPSLDRKASDLESSAGASGSGRKSAGLKDSTLHSVNKATTQIKKPPHRRNASPINWFPRKKMDSFLKRKIRHLQEVGGMNLTLDETLENANPHYTRIAREKIAAQEAARKAMEARKAAMIEASWCRILRAARIQSKLAEEELEKAEKCAADAFEAARSMGVMMYDRPDCPRGPCEVETSSAAGGRSTHTVTASFETAFDVDKEVAAAVKRAFIRLANFPSSSNKEEFSDILRKISQNPDTSDMHEDQSVISPEGASDHGLELEKELDPNDDATKKEAGKKQKNHKNSLLPNNDYVSASFSPTLLIDKMLDRLKDLSEDELSSLAVIVATCGLNAALLEVEHSKDHGGYLLKDRKETPTEMPSLDKFLVKHVSKLEREVQDARNSKRSNQALPDSKMSDNEVSGSDVSCNKVASDSSEFPSLDKFLVKHVSKLEREVQEARQSKKNSQAVGNERISSHTVVPSLDNCLVKHVSSLEREVQKVRDCKNSLANENNINSRMPTDDVKQSGLNEIPSLDKCLVKHVSRLEREVQKARNNKKSGLADINTGISGIPSTEVSEAQSLNITATRPCIDEIPSLDQFLVKHVSRLEREVQEARNTMKNSHVDGATLGTSETKTSEFKSGISTTSSASTAVPSLENFLVKRVSRLEREVREARKNKICNPEEDNQINSHKTKLEVSGSQLLGTDTKTSIVQSMDENTGQEDKENLDTNTALQPKNEIRQVTKHISRIERAKMESLKSFCSQDGQESGQTDEAMGLGKIFVKQPLCRLEEKVQDIKEETDQRHVNANRKAREREMQEAWGGLSLGNCIRPRLSRLEREKAAWRKAEEEQQRRGREL